ncbi:MAG: D-alanyl-D-alanine carboxypeptidase/D-alanyl-D-alanine-endopeptidase [Planctomycetes bacterium]|nr:D-alanyl-D-alanine carboxypeptidase/D-alanyl-D-alanine-endopeptidase [Planctomycetota bacterium]
MLRILAIYLLILGFQGSAHSASQATIATMGQQLRQLCQSAPQGSKIGCCLSSCENGDMLFTFNASVNRRLASITKLLVSTAAITELGPDYQFKTSLYSIGPLKNNSVQGIGIIARGDPCLDEHFSNKKPNTFFIQWAQKIRKAGITTINGPIIIDCSFFSGPAKPLSYPQDHSNQQKWYSAPASAFAWNDNCIEARAVPLASGPCRIEYRPFSPRIKIRNKSKSTRGKASKYFIISRAAHSNTLTISGSYKKTTSWFPLAIHQDPNLLHGDHFRHILQQQGITVTGTVILDRFRLDQSHLLHQEEHPLLPALKILNQRSQNFYGEQILRVLGYQLNKIGSIHDGCVAVRHYLKKHLRIDDAQLQILDGCGLSYDNMASPSTMCRILNAMHRHPSGSDFHDTLRTAKYSWAQKYASKVKTGSLSVARCLSGYIDDRNGKRYAFCILLNKGSHTSISWANGLREKLYKTMITGLH